MSGMSGLFCSILADAKQYRDYNYRETTGHQGDCQQVLSYTSMVLTHVAPVIVSYHKLRSIPMTVHTLS